MNLKIVKTICFIICVFLMPTSFAIKESNYFQFDILNYHTTRQSGQTVNIYVRYCYKKDLNPKLYFDYRPLRELVLQYLEPSASFPKNVYWEDIATALGRDLVKRYPIEAISIQMDVLDNPGHQEPGNHGPIYTYGEIQPLVVYH